MTMMAPDLDAQPALATYEDVLMAAERLSGVAHRTPVLTSRMADARAGAKLFFKAENFQRTGSFKFRGAYNAVASLSPEERRRGVVTYSSGNHGQGLACAGSLLGAPVVVIMPHDAPAMKVTATRGYGAEVVIFDRFKDSREEIGRKLAAERGLTLIPPYDHDHVLAGQGTAVKELLEDVGPLDRIYVCMGGGGLLSGSLLSAKALAPECQVFGVEPEAGDDGRQSFQKGEIVKIDVPKTIADGAATAFLGRRTFPIIKRLARDIVDPRGQDLFEVRVGHRSTIPRSIPQGVALHRFLHSPMRPSRPSSTRFAPPTRRRRGATTSSMRSRASRAGSAGSARSSTAPAATSSSSPARTRSCWPARPHRCSPGAT
jgi:threonine dehydratase